MLKIFNKQRLLVHYEDKKIYLLYIVFLSKL